MNRYLRYRHPSISDSMRLPLLQARLSTEVTSFMTLALVDSGATCSFLPTDLAEILGLQPDPASTHTAVGAGGEFRTVDFRVTIELMKGGRAFADFKNWPVLVPINRLAIPYIRQLPKTRKSEERSMNHQLSYAVRVTKKRKVLPLIEVGGPG